MHKKTENNAHTIISAAGFYLHKRTTEIARAGLQWTFLSANNNVKH